MGVGLIVTGLGAYGYLVLTARVLGPKRYVPLSVLWAAIFVSGPGLFLPLQQEVGRLFAHRRLEGISGGPVLKRAAVAGLALTIPVFVLLAALFSPVSHHLFENQSLLVVAFALALVGYLLLSLIWGGLAGSERFGYYALAQGSDSGMRFLACIVLAAIGVDTPGPYGIVLGLTPIVAATFVITLNKDLMDEGPSASWGSLSSALGWLLVGSLTAQLLANGAVIAVKLLAAHQDQSRVGSFLGGLVLSRVPLFLFGAVQAALLPRLATLARSGQISEFRAGLLRLLLLVTAIATVATVLSVAIGPEALQAVFGHKYRLGRESLGFLAAASGMYMIVLVVAQPLIALGEHARSSLGWLLGLIGFAVVTLLGHDLLLRVEAGFLAGVGVALVTTSMFLRTRLKALDGAFDLGDVNPLPSSLELEP